MSKPAKSRKFRSIKFRFLLILVLLISIFAIILTLSISGWVYRGKLLENQSSMVHHAETSMDSLDLLFEQSRNDVDTIAALGDLKDFVMSSYDFDQIQDIDDEDYLVSKEYMDSELEEFNLGSHYKSIYLLDRSGHVLVSTDKSFENNNFSYRNYFQEAMIGRPGLDSVVGSVSKELGFYFSQPIYLNDEIIGVTVIKLGHERVFELLDEIRESHIGEGRVFLVNKNQQIIYPPEDDLSFKFIKQPNTEILKNLKISAKDIVLADIFYQNFSWQLENYKEEAFFQIDSNQSLNFVIARNASEDFFLFLEQDVSLITREPRELAILTTIIVLLMSTALTFCLYLLINTLIKPIEELKLAAEKISQNQWNYSLNFSTSHNDEFADLANSFDQMVELIKSNQENLTDKVEAKTADLRENLEELEKLTNSMADREIKMIELKAEMKKLKEKEKTNEGA